MEKEAGKSLVGSILELIDLSIRYLRQQIKLTVDQSVAGPIRAAGRRAGLFLLAFALFSIAAVFIAVFLFLLLARLVGGYLPALLIVGLLFLAGGGGVLLTSGSEGNRGGKER